VLVLDEIGMTWGLGYGLALTGVSLLATLAFMFFIDRGQTIAGAAALPSQRAEIKSVVPQAGD